MARYFDPYTGKITDDGGESKSYEQREREQWAKNALIEAEYGAVESAMIGTGREMTRLGRGVQDLGLDVADVFTPDNSDIGRAIATKQTEIADKEREERELMRPLQEARPYSTGVGTALPYLATAPLTMGGGAAAATGGTAAKTAIARTASVGAVEGFLGYEETYKDRLINAGFGTGGALTGYGAGRMANRVTQVMKNFRAKPAPIKTEIKGDIITNSDMNVRYDGVIKKDQAGMKKAVDDMIDDTPIKTTNQQAADLGHLENSGYKLTPAQKQGSDTMRNFENRLSRNSYFSKPFLEIKEHNKEVFNGDVAQSIGLSKQTRSITPDKMGEALDNFQASFKSAAKNGNKLEFSPVDVDNLRQLEEFGIESIIPNNNLQKMSGRIADLIEGQGISAKTYVAQRGALTKMTKDATKGAGKSVELEPVQGMIDMLDDAFTRSNPNKLDQLNKTREQYRIYKTLMKGNNLALDGDVNYQTFTNSMKRDFINPMRAQRNLEYLQPETKHLIDSARSLDRVKDVLPTSGTAENLSMGDLSPEQIALKAVGNIASRGAITAAGTSTGQSLMSMPYKQIFNTQPTGAGLLEAYAAGAGIGGSQ